ncbi:MAG: KH domain-containing protein [Lentisphaeria bacterium]|nr:KH domain-containing protein [Lentisphaeria bacterium]
MFKWLSFLTGGSKKAAPAPAADGDVRKMESFVEYVVKSLVDSPDQVEITSVDGEEGAVTIQVRCCKEDIGKIVGKRGKTIMAIRSLVSGAAGRQHKRVSVDVLD